jgi:prepilin-type N-terminal cleavage/methylation domain-containing protein
MRLLRNLGHRLADQRGFTIIEVLIASMLALVILGATLNLFDQSAANESSVITKSDTVQVVTAETNSMAQDLRQAYEINYPVSTTTTNGCTPTAGVQPCNIIDVLSRLPVSGGGYSDYEIHYDCTISSTTISADRACWRYLCSANAATTSTSSCTPSSSTYLSEQEEIDDVSNGTTAAPVFSFCYPTTTTGSACGSGAARPTSVTITIDTPAAGTLTSSQKGDPATIKLTDGVYMANLDYNQ